MRENPATSADLGRVTSGEPERTPDVSLPVPRRRNGVSGNGDERGQRRTLATAVNVVQALEAVAADPRGVPAKAVARRLGQSLSSAYYVLQSLSALGFVEPSPVSHGLYTLGPKIAELFRGYVASWTLPHRLEPILLELRDRAGVRVYAARWSDADLEVTCVRGRRGATELQDVSVGFRGAAHALALGKVLLEAVPPDHWPAYLRKPRFQAYTEATITVPSRLHEELLRVRRVGYALDVEEYARNVCCVAAPIRDGAGRVLAAIGASVSARRFRYEENELRAAVLEVAATASKLLKALDPLSMFLSTVTPRACYEGKGEPAAQAVESLEGEARGNARRDSRAVP
ncbi:IclR family transcriptional regulator [Carbonactinospora thermoautotrophica]|uniref:IclR family transcriptional regulator n=1 Tax=Carbonactinospora thermoautotrophica TaxID=1469144 RepID=UPI00227228D5|nr:IclR family transcriptional regulator [Carbonactinospora thermoautotrophica]MCX9192186.1 IclR family transcriptional regulator [Carbonactinospora thermoautotrophica]